MLRLYACSSNAGKLAEFSLAAGAFQIAPLPGIERLETPEETGSTFEENAVLKALYFSRFTEELVFADDSGLEVDFLGGAPGVRSARFAGAGASDAANIELLLSRLAGVADRRARFVTVLALAQAGKVLKIAYGSVEGQIGRAARGRNGFGYDPIFFYPPLQRTFAELTDDEKFAVSARGTALRLLVEEMSGELHNADVS